MNDPSIYETHINRPKSKHAMCVHVLWLHHAHFCVTFLCPVVSMIIAPQLESWTTSDVQWLFRVSSEGSHLVVRCPTFR